MKIQKIDKSFVYVVHKFTNFLTNLYNNGSNKSV